jgi:hypothetical protein
LQQVNSGLDNFQPHVQYTVLIQFIGGNTPLYSFTFQEELIIPVSFPDVVGAFIPTVTIALINTFSALRIAKNPTLTHKDANKPIYSSLAYQVCPGNKNACYS